MAYDIGSLTFRQVACLARQGRGAEAEVETVDIEEMEEARDERDESEIMDSGLDPEDVALVTEGRRDDILYLSRSLTTAGY